MADIMEIIRSRRTIRQYEEKEVPEEVLNEVLDALRWSQSWANTQCWELVVVRDQGVKNALQETLPGGNPARNAVAAAPVVLALCAKLECAGYFKGSAATKLGDWFMFDLGLATENIALAAHALGLGTVVVGMFDHTRAKAALNVPEGYELATLMPLGYPARQPAAPKRKDVSGFTHYDRF